MHLSASQKAGKGGLSQDHLSTRAQAPEKYLSTEFTHEPFPWNVFVLLSDFEGSQFHLWLSKNLSLMHQVSFCLCPNRMFNKILVKNKIPRNKVVHLLSRRCNWRRLIFGELDAFSMAIQGRNQQLSLFHAQRCCCWTWLLCQGWCGGRNLQAQSRNAIHLLVVGDPPACGIIVNWEANKRDSEMSLHGITCIFVDGGSGVVFGYQLCPVVTLLSLRFPPLPSCFHHYRLLFTPQLLTLHTTTKETADPTLFLFDPRFVSREPNETSRSGAA